MQKQISVGDIFAQFGGTYINKNRLPEQQRSIIQLLSACGTTILGSHFEQCDHCSYTGKANNQCRNRHCPHCQHKEKAGWMEKRMGELLPVGYYHLVFTLPHELNALCLQNKKTMYGLLFKAASETVLEWYFFFTLPEKNIETARRLLSEDAANDVEEAIEDGLRVMEKQGTVWNEISQAIKNYQKPNCPVCKKGRLRFAGIVYDDSHLHIEPG